jgi:hypothetical protein
MKDWIYAQVSTSGKRRGLRLAYVRITSRFKRMEELGSVVRSTGTGRNLPGRG